jgi:hypothetical protein
MTRPDRRRPPVRLSSLPFYSFDLDVSDRCVMICCPVCGAWKSVRRSLIEAHRRPGPARSAEGSVGWPLPPWCKGSGRRLVCDVSHADWLAGLQEGARDAARRRSGRAVRRPRPPVPAAVTQIAAAR